MSKDLEGKVFLVTGGTEGIGKAAALDFARRGATLVIVGRNPDKSERVIAELKQAGNYDKVDLLLGDMSLIADIRAVAKQFAQKYDRLDVLVNNAGALFSDYALTSDGIERTFALNHLGYFLLTIELLDLIKKTPGARVVSTSSGAHMMGKLDLATVAKRKGSAGFAAYADSKLANVLFTRELGRRLAGSSAVANCYHPGYVGSAFGQNNGGFSASIFKLGAKFVGRSVEKGAETLIWLATHPEAARLNGQYFYDKKVSRVFGRGTDDEFARSLWELSEKLCAG